MEDNLIVDLFFARQEEAIVQTDRKYGKLCYSIAFNVLACREDAQERVNDTYLTAWKVIPPNRPRALGAYLGKITRRLSLDCLRKQNALRRGGGELPAVLEEIEDLVCGGTSPEAELMRKEMEEGIARFLAGLKKEERNVFLFRYWYLDSIAAIADMTGNSQSKVVSMLYRLRKKLKKQLTKEGML